MPRPKQKTKAEDLTRVRNNQRRCRERKREYVAELESRIAFYEAAAAQGNMKLQAREEQLRSENQRLRALLEFSGISASFLEQYLAEEEQQDPPYDLEAGLGLVADPELPTVESHSSLLMPLESSTIISDSVQFPVGEMASAGLDPSFQWAFDLPASPSGTLGLSFGFITPNTQAASLLATEPSLAELLSLANQNVEIATGSSNAVLKDTTLCVVALQLVIHCNKKKVDMLELNMKLRCGYRRAQTPQEGCRIDNRVLLAVLAEIFF
ncbi:hypothetical protein VTN77DRAFT_9682 [Rasamsonia byssochlamydoides]|uniref:uncharacterized protein n=1 Tax=Rasamsonia byssochlamydoides TaxID=89139 RepID=UPI0037427708